MSTLFPCATIPAMHRLVPDLILENYRNQSEHGSFRAVGLFLDLSGFSTLTDALAKQGQHGAEVLVGMMHNIFDPLVESIFEHGGRIVGFAGDGIMALFPITGDERSTALHALASAWWIQQGLSTRTIAQTSFGSFRFSAKVGLALGEASWGILRSREQTKATYYFRGSAVDDSAKAEHQAKPGEVYLSEEATRVLAADVTVARGASFHKLTGILSELPLASVVHLPPLDETSSRAFVADNILARGEHGEFRQAVNLFMRFPDLPYDALQETFQIMFTLQEQYGGLLSRLDFGDKGCNTLMLWGAPVAYENDIGRALNFLQDLKSRVHFPITAGVTYYIAHAGFLGGEMSECYTCYGWGVNLASRFMMSAPDGATWIDERIARRIKNRFEFDYMGAQKFKGFETEQKVFSLRARKPQLEALFQGEFVGREVELPRLIDFLQPLWRGDFAGIMVIWGDAGIGKSRLVYELKHSGALKSQNVLWAFCHSDQILRHSFNPFRYWLLRFFDILIEQDDENRTRLFDSKLDALLTSTPDPELVDTLQRGRYALGSLLDLSWPDSPFEKLDAEGRYNTTLLALIALLKAESLRQPIILFIEDAQFLDEDSRAFLPRLKRAIVSSNEHYPIAILVSSRRSGSSLLEESLPDATMELGALSAQALSSLAEIQLGASPSSELVRLLQERSEGNPYFAEQILTYLQEESLLEMSEKGWRVARLLRESSLPADIRALLMARLDQLSPSVRDLIQTASILGREFDLPLLTAVLRDKSNLLVELAEAESAEILVPVNLGRFTFTHGLLRDAAYSMQMRARRVELHALAVNALERIYASDLEPHAGELAHHAEQANLTDKALHYLPLAGRRSAGLYQNAQAIDYFSRALALLPAGNQRARFDLLLERVEVHKRMGNRKAQWEDIQALERLAAQLGDVLARAKERNQRAHYLFTTGEYRQAIEVSGQVIQLASDRSLSETLDAYVLWFFSLLHFGNLDLAMAKAHEALAKTGTETLKNRAQILNGMGLISIEQNDLLLASQHLTEAIEIAHSIGDIPVEIRALTNLGNVAAASGDYAMAADCYEKAYASVHARGDRYGESVTLGNLGWVVGMQGDFSAARHYHQQALNIAREVANQYQEAFTLINLSVVLGIQGDAIAALECARLANDLCVRLGERSGEAWSLLNIGHASLLVEELSEAQLAYEQCLAIRQELQQMNLAAEALAGLLDIALLRNDAGASSRHLESILSIMERNKELPGAEEPLRIYYSCYQALIKMKDPRSRVVLQDALQILEAQVSKFKDEDARRMYVENVPWRRAFKQAAQTAGS